MALLETYTTLDFGQVNSRITRSQQAAEMNSYIWAGEGIPSIEDYLDAEISEVHIVHFDPQWSNLRYFEKQIAQRMQDLIPELNRHGIKVVYAPSSLDYADLPENLDGKNIVVWGTTTDICVHLWRDEIKRNTSETNVFIDAALCA